MKQFVSIVAMVFAVLVIGGCGASSGDPATTQSQPAQEANPAGAIEKIYETIEMRGLVDAQDEDVTDRFQMNLENIESYNIRYSLGRFGVADTFIIKPAEGKKGIYRKEYSNKNGEAYRKFDADAKELTDKVKGKKILEAENLEIKVGGATVTVGKSGAVTINSPAGITIKAAGTMELSASTITASAGTVNITGGGGDVVVSGKSLVNHTHKDSLSGDTTPPV